MNPSIIYRHDANSRGLRRVTPVPVIVAGMHRSGTSLVASILSALGLDMGERLLAADRNNRSGYFEDLDFLALQRRMLCESTRSDDGGHRDWGWTESEQLDRRAFQAFQEEAKALVARRAGAGRSWGWKDPRTTVALDFWDSLLDHARYVLVYRHPWEVADSMQRLGADVFLLRPDYAYRIWAFYNRHLLDFHRRHRERCLLVSTDACVREPARLLDLLATRLGLDGSRLRLDDLVDAELFQSQEEDDPLIPLAAAAHPECAALLAELDRAADLSSSGLWSAEPPRARSTDAVATRLSVIIPCYDQGEFLLEAVASVERSVPEVCELIVVNDGSREPRTLEVLALLREAGYRVVDQENAGLAAARNCGIELARGPYILPLDADNRLRPGFIPAALELLDASPEVGVVYGDRFDFGLRNGTVDVPPFDLDGLLPFNYIDACALLRKEVWSACGGYDPAMLIWEDWEFWIGAAERGWQFHHLPGEAFDYRVRPHSMLSAVADEELRRRLYSYVIAKHRDLYWQRLPELLIAAQHSAADLFRLAREHERTQAEAGATFQEQAARMESSEVERISLKREIAALRAEHERTRVEGEAQAARLKSLEGEAGVLLGEREQLYAELRAWSERVLFMEGTRAWRLRQRLVDLKRALGRHFSAGSLQKQ